jgi:NADH-quinone oxidoreductase subunit J
VTASPEQVLFGVFAFAVIFSSCGVIFARNGIASAMSLVACFFFLAGVYVLLWAHTVAALQVLVYAGAIMVLFLFVLMLLSTSYEGPTMTFSVSRVAGSLGVVAMFAALVSVFMKLPAPTYAWTNDAGAVASFGTIARVGEVMYTQWLFPFEAVSLLLLVAILGAVVVAKARV